MSVLCIDPVVEQEGRRHTRFQPESFLIPAAAPRKRRLGAKNEKRSVATHFSCFDANLLRYISSASQTTELLLFFLFRERRLGKASLAPPLSLSLSFPPSSDTANLPSVRRLIVDQCLWLISFFFGSAGLCAASQQPQSNQFLGLFHFLCEKSQQRAVRIFLTSLSSATVGAPPLLLPHKLLLRCTLRPSAAPQPPIYQLVGSGIVFNHQNLKIIIIASDAAIKTSGQRHNER